MNNRAKLNSHEINFWNMKRYLLLTLVSLFSVASFAQVQVIEVIHEADTLLYPTNRENGTIELYKNKDGYLIKVDSSNMFDKVPSFFLGKDISTSLESLDRLHKLCENDVATQVIISDAMGVPYIGFVAYGSHYYYKRRPTYIKSDTIYLKNEDMSGVIEISQKELEMLKKLIRK